MDFLWKLGIMSSGDRIAYKALKTAYDSIRSECLNRRLVKLYDDSNGKDLILVFAKYFFGEPVSDPTWQNYSDEDLEGMKEGMKKDLQSRKATNSLYDEYLERKRKGTL